MIILQLNRRPDFEKIQEQILTGAIIPNFDEALARLLCHTSTATQSMHSEITPDTSLGKLNYLTITRPNISFLVSVVSQFL